MKNSCAYVTKRLTHSPKNGVMGAYQVSAMGVKWVFHEGQHVWIFGKAPIP